MTDLRAHLNGRRLILIDGPAGSGKTTLADAVGAPVIHLDDLIEGWAGIQAGIDQAQSVIDALGQARPAGYRRYDWHLGTYAEDVPVPPTDLLVIEGVGAGSVRADALLVWVEAPEHERLRRGLARDGEGMREHWVRWMLDEQMLFERDRTKARAEVYVSTFP